MSLVGSFIQLYEVNEIILLSTAGAIELVDVSHKLTGLNYCKGTYSWKVSGLVDV